MKRLVVTTIVFAALIALWEWLVRMKIWSPVLVPSPVSVVRYIVGALRDGTVVFGGLDIFRKAGRWDGLERLVWASGRQRGFGDYFGHTFVARGQAEAMVELDLKPWDLAAVKIIIEEAGGRFTDFTGAATIYGGDAIASNSLVHDEILKLLRSPPCGQSGL